MRLVTTHVSWLIMTSTRVYKLKRPVRFPFLDLTSPDARRYACEQEVLLNSRLSPDVYEGVGAIVDPDGTTEPMVVMRRLPSGRRLSTLVSGEHPALGGEIDGLAELMSRFHAAIRRTDAASQHGAPDAVRLRWSSNLSELRDASTGLLDPMSLDELDAAGQRFMSSRRALFDARVREGHIVEGHGDLLADDVYFLDDGPRVLDCLEFDFALRCVDTACEIASLAVDLERLGRRDLADRVETQFKDVSGEVWPASLFAFYCAYRASVRAKIACLRAAEGDDDARAEAVGLVALARRRLAEDAIRLVLVGGLPGSGKSTVARHLGDATGWPVLRSDEIRRALMGPSGATPEFGADLYEAERVAAVYAEMLERAATAMRMGHSVILDATWNRDCWRAAARSLARDCAANIIEMRCDVAVDVALERVAERRRRGGDVSEATPEVTLRLAQLADPWPEAHSVDTALEPFATARVALRIVKAAGATVQSFL